MLAALKAKITTPKFNYCFGLLVFCLVMVLVLLNIFSPLRLNTDGIRYLKILEYFKGTLDKNSGAAHDYLPHGYPAFLFILNKLQLLSPLTITLINILSTLLSAYVAAKLLGINNRLLYFSLVMLSFINIKQYAIPLADQLFTLTFMVAIYCWSAVFKGRWVSIIPALIVTTISICIRTAGISIVFGILFYSIYLNREVLYKRKLVPVLLVVMVVLLIAGFITHIDFFAQKTDYVRQLNIDQLIKQPLSGFQRLAIHLKELGEIVVNVPYSKLSAIINRPGIDIAENLLVVIGIVAAYCLCHMISYLKLFRSFLFWAFLGYVLMIVIWPFYDTRFLIPIVSVVIYLLIAYLSHIIKATYTKCIVALPYIVFGIVSAFYSDNLSLSNTFFLNHYGFDKTLTEKYRIHFNNQKLNKKPVYNINKDDILYLLEKYDKPKP